MRSRMLLVGLISGIAVLPIWWLYDAKVSDPPSSDSNEVGVAFRHSDSGSTESSAGPELATPMEDRTIGNAPASWSAGYGVRRPAEVLASAPSAAAAISELRAMDPSEDVNDALVVAELVCRKAIQQERKRNQDGRSAPSWEESHFKQVHLIVKWCGEDVELISAARLEVSKSRSTALFKESDANRAQALGDAEGGLAASNVDQATELMFETRSLAVADGLALNLLGLEVDLVGQIPAANQASVAWLAAAMVYCQRKDLCAPVHPRTILECLNAPPCAPGRNLLDLRWAGANEFEREMAQRLVAGWNQRRTGPGRG